MTYFIYNHSDIFTSCLLYTLLFCLYHVSCMVEYNLILHNTGIRKLFSFTNIYHENLLPLNYSKYNMISLYYLILNPSFLGGGPCCSSFQFFVLSYLCLPGNSKYSCHSLLLDQTGTRTQDLLHWLRTRQHQSLFEIDAITSTG